MDRQIKHGSDGVTPSSRQFHVADYAIPDYFSQELAKVESVGPSTRFFLGFGENAAQNIELHLVQSDPVVKAF